MQFHLNLRMVLLIGLMWHLRSTANATITFWAIFHLRQMHIWGGNLAFVTKLMINVKCSTEEVNVDSASPRPNYNVFLNPILRGFALVKRIFEYHAQYSPKLQST